jgi:hypothetical protein
MLLKNFRNSRVFKWGLARAYEEIDLRKSIETYFEILNSYLKTGVRTRVNEITLKHIIAQQYVKLGEKKKHGNFAQKYWSTKTLPILKKKNLRID